LYGILLYIAVHSHYLFTAYKDALRLAASREHRSIANLIEMLIRDYCEQNGICMTELGDRLVIKETDKVK
jgi:hypothetical protein